MLATTYDLSSPGTARDDRPSEARDDRRPPQPASRDDQRRAALARANAVRTARARLRRAVHEGDRSVADVVADPPPEARSMPVGELLAAQHRWGATRAARTLHRVPVPETKAVGALTARQRRALVALLGDGAPPTVTP